MAQGYSRTEIALTTDIAGTLEDCSTCDCQPNVYLEDDHGERRFVIACPDCSDGEGSPYRYELDEQDAAAQDAPTYPTHDDLVALIASYNKLQRWDRSRQPDHDTVAERAAWQRERRAAVRHAF